MPKGESLNAALESLVALMISTIGALAMAVKSQLTGREARDSEGLTIGL